MGTGEDKREQGRVGRGGFWGDWGGGGGGGGGVCCGGGGGGGEEQKVAVNLFVLLYIVYA